MTTIIQARDKAGWRGHGQLYITRWAGEVQRDRAGIVREAPSCFGLAHPVGVCPHGHRHQVERREKANKVVNGWYSAQLDLALGLPGAASTLLTYVSAGTGAAATDNTDIALGAEVWRGALTNRERNSPTEITCNFYLAAGAVNAFLHEWGIWAGAASATLGSGLLVARFNLDAEVDAQTSADGLWTLSKA